MLFDEETWQKITNNLKIIVDLLLSFRKLTSYFIKLRNCECYISCCTYKYQQNVYSYSSIQKKINK